jgi:hypothetical protein
MEPTEWVGLTVGLIAILSGILAGFSWLTRAIVRDELTKATKPIQPGYRNGGESLADVANNVKRIMARLELEDE